MTGEIGEDVDAIGADLLDHRIVAHRRGIPPVGAPALSRRVTSSAELFGIAETSNCSGSSVSPAR